MPSPTPAELEEARALVRRHFGFADVRAGQAEIVARVKRGEDVLAILPTGGGKSVCYQVAPAFTQGVTLVVSPLLALMKDQLDGLPPHMRRAADSLTSEMPPASQRRLLDEVAAGRIRLLYVAPERLRQPSLLDALRAAGVGRLVVDEAHCVSTWGHDFRPEYLAIADARRKLGDPPILALTATAPPRVAAEIVERLGAKVVVRGSVHRANLRLEAVEAKDADEKLAHLLRLCLETQGPGVVYANSRAKTEQLAAALAREGVRAEAYHAGLPDRALRQDAFMRSEVDVLVATVAFGMGVDKADIRFIFHHDPSSSLENYVQESGRAGRDGRRSRCVVIATRADATGLKTRAKADLPSRVLIGEVWRLLVETRLEDGTALLDPNLLDRLDPEDSHKPRVALRMLEEAGAVERVEPRPGHEGLPTYRLLGEPARVEPVLERHQERAAQRGEETMAYVRTKACRHAHVLRFFGETPPFERCGNCDNCLGLAHEPLAPRAEDEQEAARMVLAAMSSVRGLGETNLVLFLRGDARAPDWLARKSGFGCLAFRSESKVKALVRALEARGLLSRETLEHGGSALRLSDEGRQALGGDELLLPVPDAGKQREPSFSASSAPPASEALTEEGQKLFAALKQWRRSAADEEGVPPYVVAHDKTLAAIAEARPRNLAELQAVKGMGPKRVEKYGDAILRIVIGG